MRSLPYSIGSRFQCLCYFSEPEPQILDYMTQQHKLFIGIATSHALQLAGDWLWSTFTKVLADMRRGNVESLPEVIRNLNYTLSAFRNEEDTTCLSAILYEDRFSVEPKVL